MKFVIYSKQGCPYCDRVKKVLTGLSETKQYLISVYELGKDFTREQFYSEFGEGSTFPQVILNDEHIGGCVDTVNYLMENNMF
jgi:glutaredoxin